MSESVAEILEAMDALVKSEDSFNQAEFSALESKLEFAKARENVASFKRPVRSDIGAYVSESNNEDAERSAAFNRYLRTGDKGIAAEFAQSVGTNSQGGFTAPDGFRNKLVDRLKAFGGLAAEAETITTDTGTDLTWVTLDDTANLGEIAAEGSAGTAGADFVFGEKTLKSYKYVAPGADNSGEDPLRVSVELLQDSAFDIEALIVRKLGERIARKQAAHFVTGTGTGEPEGITDPAATASFLDTTAYSDLIDIIHAVDPDYRRNAKWLMNDTTLATIRKLVDQQDRPLWLPAANAGLTELPGGTLLGYPVVIDQAMPTMTFGATPNAAKGLVFGDLTESYVVRRVKDVQLVVDPYTRAAQGQVCFTLWARADGAIQNDYSFVIAAAG